jgi:hypothetical protein
MKHASMDVFDTMAMVMCRHGVFFLPVAEYPLSKILQLGENLKTNVFGIIAILPSD